jgi:transaldolase
MICQKNIIFGLYILTGMEKELTSIIRQFILSGTHESAVISHVDFFWQNLRETGTELWLDTGDMDEAARNWTREMTALTTNNTLLNTEIQKGKALV